MKVAQQFIAGSSFEKIVPSGGTVEIPHVDRLFGGALISGEGFCLVLRECQARNNTLGQAHDPAIQPRLKIAPLFGPFRPTSAQGLRKISSETGSLTLAPDGIPVTSTRLFRANGLITMSGFDVGIA